MLDYNSVDDTKNTPQEPILKAIDMLCSLTEYRLNSTTHIKQAFLLGLWHQSFPSYMLGNVESAQAWQYPGLHPENAGPWYNSYSNLQRFQFVSATADSWHQCYQDVRSLGWKRLKVHREGGRLQYLLLNFQAQMPEGYKAVHLVLDISIATCKQVQVGTETKEVPIMKTICEDLVEIDDDKEDADRAAAIYPSDENISFPKDPFCDHGKLSGNCSQSDCPHFSDAIPF